MNKKTIAATILITVLAFSIGYLANTSLPHKNPRVSANVYITENVGGVSAEIYSGNLITDIGEAYARDAILTLDGNTTNWSISLSNDGSPAAAWTELTTEVAANGFTRAAGDSVTWTNSGDAAFNVTYTFTASGTQQLQTAGLQWDDTPSSDNNLFAAADFTQTTFESADTLTVTWVITVNAN